MIFPLLIPSLYGGHTTVRNHVHIDTAGIQRGLRDLTDATKTNGKHLDRIATEMEAEKHLVTVKAGEIHESAVLVGQILWDTREAYNAAVAKTSERIDRIRAWQLDRIVRRDTASHMARLRETQAERESLEAEALSAWRGAVSEASADFTGQRGFFLFRKSLEHFQKLHDVAGKAAELEHQRSLGHVLNDDVFRAADIAGVDPWEWAESVVVREMRRYDSDYVNTWSPVTRREVRPDPYGIYHHPRRTWRYNNLRYGDTRRIIERVVGQCPPEISHTDDVCNLAEVTRYTPGAVLQVKASTLICIGKIASQIEPNVNEIQKQV